MPSTRCIASANRSCELTRCCLLASLETARSLPRLRINPINCTNKHADHAKPQHACAAHACVEENTVCTWLWLCFCSWLVLRSREFVERLVVVDGRPLALHRETHNLGILPRTKPIFCEDRFVLPSQVEVFFFVDHGIPRHP